MKRKKIILASRLFRPEAGAATFSFGALADGFNPDTIDVKVLTTKPPFNIAVAPEAKNIGVSRFPVLRDRSGNVRGYIQYLSFDIPLFFRLLATSGDLVVAQSPPTTGFIAALACKLRPRPFVYYANDLLSEAVKALNVSQPIAKFVKFLEVFSLQQATKIISVSSALSEKIEALGLPAQKIVVVNHGADTKIFNLSVQEVSNKSHTLYFVYTGTMSEIHGSGIFLEGFEIFSRQHPEVALHFIGQGTDTVFLKEEVKRKDLKVTFQPLMPPAQVARWIKGSIAALASIVPDRGYDFARATKIYPAAACGKPTIFAGKGISKKLIDENNLGYSCAYNAQEVAVTMEKAYADFMDGTSNSLEEQRVQWVQNNASLQTLGKQAAQEVVLSLT